MCLIKLSIGSSLQFVQVQVSRGAAHDCYVSVFRPVSWPAVPDCHPVLPCALKPYATVVTRQHCNRAIRSAYCNVQPLCRDGLA